MRRVLITGAAGFVGRHFTRYFLDRGDLVCAVDPIVPRTGGIDPDTGWPFFEARDYDNFVFFKQDCRVFFREHCQEYYDYVFHLAAVVGGRLMIEHNPLAVADDLSIDSEYWQWAVKAKPAKSVVFSSSAAYPIKYQLPQHYCLLREEMIQFEHDIGFPDLTYGWAKLTCEYLARLAYERHGLKSVVYRPFSGYGEDQDDTYPFPSICKRVLRQKGASKLTVWGSGNQMRDFVHIADCVRGVIMTMDLIDNGDALNLSTGVLTSFKEFAELAARLAGCNPEIIGTSDKPEGVFARGGDIEKQKEFGFNHKICLEDGIRQALGYYSRIGASVA